MIDNNSLNEPIGFTMPLFTDLRPLEEIQYLDVVTNRIRWKIGISFLGSVLYLYVHGIQIGDYNFNNFGITDDCEVVFMDVDSYVYGVYGTQMHGRQQLPFVPDYSKRSSIIQADYLLLDSMVFWILSDGIYVDTVNQCLVNLIQDLKGNPVLSHKIDLRIVSFNTQYTEILPFTMVDRIEVSRLKKVEQAEWATFLGTALSRAVEELAEEKAMFKASNAEYTQPNLIVLSDGYPEKEDASVTAKGIKDVQSKIQNERWNCIPIFIGHDFGSNILGDISVPDSYGHKTVITFDSNDKKSDIIEAFKFASMSVGAVGEQAGSPSYKPMSTSELKQKILEAEKRREKIKKNSSQSQKKSLVCCWKQKFGRAGGLYIDESIFASLDID